MSSDVEILLTRHFLKRLEERAEKLSVGGCVFAAIVDLAQAAGPYYAGGVDVMGTVCSKKGNPLAKIVGRTYENERGRRLMVRTIMPATFKHNVANLVRTVDVGFVGPNRPNDPAKEPKAAPVEKRSDKLENLLCALRREIGGQEKALRNARPGPGDRAAIFARHVERINRAAEDVREQAKREGIDV